ALSWRRAAWMQGAKPAPPRLALYPCKQQGKNRPEPGLSCVYNALIETVRRRNRTITGEEQRNPKASGVGRCDGMIAVRRRERRGGGGGFPPRVRAAPAVPRTPSPRARTRRH